MATLYYACAGELVLSGMTLAVGGYLGIHPLLLIVSHAFSI